MAQFRVIFVEVHGIQQNDLGIRDLHAGTLEEARKEARTCAGPIGTNMMVISQEGKRVEVLGVEPDA